MIGFFKRKSRTQPPSADEAIARAQRGDNKGALKEVDALIAEAPGVAMSHRFRGETLFAMNRYDEAIESFLTAERLGGPAMEELFFWIALAHANAERPDRAVEILQEYIDSPAASPDLSQKCKAAIAQIQGTPG
ncbi:Tetratricopeptide repeat protein [Gimesia panareensis]|uniref:Tetratricopeptide repeat protein n=1 Tax=Gimesia panareensis TaxID=2527978 RepID=A0A517Q522_9PLAN|nr:tetratricopeptide repeat protein [Gimesia panareensis]QDT26738.1 Tetratricopeptide repeat protein [Gimesia panareensis]